MKEHLGKPLLLSKPVAGEKLFLYLAVSESAVSLVLVREDNKVQHPVYYLSKRLLDTELRYPGMEKLAYAFVISSRKIRLYFQAHTIDVLTSYPLCQVLQKPEASGCLLKWAVELGQFDIHFRPRTIIKWQALANFIVEFTYQAERVVEEEQEKIEQQWWKLYVDGSSNDCGAGVGLMLISPEGHKINCALRFGFNASNNEAEYEAFLLGLRLAKEMKAGYLQIFSDSRLVVKQVTEEYQARGEKMVAYLKSAQVLLKSFDKYNVI